MGTLFYSREIFVVYALPTASVPNKTYVQLGVSLARNSGMRPPLQSKGRTYRRAKPIFVSTLLITLKGILPLAALAEPTVTAGLCPTPQQGASPLHLFLRSPLGEAVGGTPRPISTSVFRPRRVKVKPLSRSAAPNLDTSSQFFREGSQQPRCSGKGCARYRRGQRPRG